MFNRRGPRVLTVFALLLSFGGAAAAYDVSTYSDPVEGACGIHEPAHSVTYTVTGTVDLQTFGGSHYWDPIYDETCGAVISGDYPPIVEGHYWSFGCEGGPVAATLTGLIIGGGCGTVAGPNGQDIVPEVQVGLEHGQSAYAYGESWWYVDDLSTPRWEVRMDEAGALGGPISNSVPIW
jgi:hypothetical protein